MKTSTGTVKEYSVQYITYSGESTERYTKSVSQREVSGEEEGRSKDDAQSDNTRGVDPFQLSDRTVTSITVARSTRRDTNRTSLGRTMSGKLGSRIVCAVCSALVHIRIQQNLVDDMEHPVLRKHVRLDDLRGCVAGGDKLSARVGADVDVLTGRGDVGGVDEAWAVDGCSVNDVVPQNVPELGGVGRDVWNLGRSLIGGDEEGETTDSVEDLRDGGIFVSTVSGIPNRNVGVRDETGEPCQVAVCFKRAVDVAWVIENSTNSVEVLRFA